MDEYDLKAAGVPMVAQSDASAEFNIREVHAVVKTPQNEAGPLIVKKATRFLPYANYNVEGIIGTLFPPKQTME